MAKFKTGKSGNMAGRPKGAPNRKTVDLRARIKDILDDNIDKVQKDLDALEPKDRLVILERFMQYIIPRKKEEEITFSERDKFMKKFFGTGSVSEKDEE